MRREILLLLCVAIFPLMLANIGDAAIDPETIAGIWLFDEGSGEVAHDSSDNRNHGKLENAPKWVPGKFGQALEFAFALVPGKGRVGAYVEVPHSQSLKITKEITVTAWIRTSKTGEQAIVGKDNDVAGERCWNLESRHMGAAGPEGALGFAIFPADITAFGEAPLFTGEWIFAAAVYDGREIRVYVNGVLDGAQAMTGNMGSFEEPVKIGVKDETNGLHRFFWGTIDEVAIFNEALTENDLKTIMSRGLRLILAVSSSEKLAITWGETKTPG